LCYNKNRSAFGGRGAENKRLKIENRINGKRNKKTLGFGLD